MLSRTSTSVGFVILVLGTLSRSSTAIDSRIHASEPSNNRIRKRLQAADTQQHRRTAASALDEAIAAARGMRPPATETLIAAFGGALRDRRKSDLEEQIATTGWARYYETPEDAYLATEDESSFWKSLNGEMSVGHTEAPSDGGGGESPTAPSAPSEAPDPENPLPGSPEAPSSSPPPPAEISPSEAAPSSEVAPTESAPSEAPPPEAAPSVVTPSEVTPPEAAPSETAPSEVAPSEEEPSEAAPSVPTPPPDPVLCPGNEASDVCDCTYRDCVQEAQFFRPFLCDCPEAQACCEGVTASPAALVFTDPPAADPEPPPPPDPTGAPPATVLCPGNPETDFCDCTYRDCVQEAQFFRPFLCDCPEAQACCEGVVPTEAPPPQSSPWPPTVPQPPTQRPRTLAPTTLPEFPPTDSGGSGSLSRRTLVPALLLASALALC